MKLVSNKLNLLFKSKKVIKVIAGLDNCNVTDILKVAKAAELAKATYLDVVANTSVVQLLKKFVNIPICVSSVNPVDLYNCVILGADLVEIGNFNCLYKKSKYLTTSQIINLAQETRLLIGNEINICVTIPCYLYLHEQIELAKRLEQLGVNTLQTEGFVSKQIINSKIFRSDNIFKSISLSAASLSSTYVISNTVKIPVIASSNINCLSSPVSIFYGASGVGIGSSVHNQKNIYNMYCYINEIYKSISNINTFNIKSCSILERKYLDLDVNQGKIYL